jgi:SAM-dependent methyltransferase
MSYLFSDTDLAARRLRLLGKVFGPSTEALLRDAGVGRPRLAVDLGCGPGYSTHLLARTLRCDRAVGLDKSEHFVELARQTATEEVSFCLHDVTHVPFPVKPADLLYCKFLLTHLSDPRASVAKWAAQLEPRGLLVMEDVEWIRTDSPVFSRYIGIVEAMLAHHGSDLYVGALLNRLPVSDAFQQRTSRVWNVPVASHRAAQIFSMNIQSWKHQPFAQANYSAEEIGRLEQDLAAMVSQPAATARIEWGLRQLVLERVWM